MAKGRRLGLPALPVLYAGNRLRQNGGVFLVLRHRDAKKWESFLEMGGRLLVFGNFLGCAKVAEMASLSAESTSLSTKSISLSPVSISLSAESISLFAESTSLSAKSISLSAESISLSAESMNVFGFLHNKPHLSAGFSDSAEDSAGS